MRQVKVLVGCSGPAGSFTAGEKPVVSEEVAADLIAAGYGEPVEETSNRSADGKKNN